MIVELNVDVRITPYSSLIPLSKSRTNTSSVYNRNRFASPNIINRGRLNLDNSSHSIAHQDRTQFKKTQYLIPAKTLRSSNNNNRLLLISKKNTNNPQFSVKITPKINQPTNRFQTSGFKTSRFQKSEFPTSSLADGLADDRRVLLYKQIERNKFSSNGAELINRFNYRV